MAKPPAAQTFDYAAVSATVAAEAQAVAQRVREHHRQTVQSILEIGRDLMRVKGQLGHGNFGAWLALEFGGVARTAQNYMLAAERFGDKSEIISQLSPSTIYRLAAPSTPDPVRQEVVARLEAGDSAAADDVPYMVKVALRKEREERDRAKAAAERATLPAEKMRAADRRDARFEREGREAEERRAALRAAFDEVVAILSGRVGDDAPRLIGALRRTGNYALGSELADALEAKG